MKVLGIDPGLENTGWAVVEKQGEAFKLVEWGVVKVAKGQRGGERLLEIGEAIGEVIERHRIEKVGLESLFFARNARSAMGVAEAVGVIKLVAAKAGVKVVEITPLQIKMALTGYGRAEKGQVEEMARGLLGLEEMISPSHAADAAAAGLTVCFCQEW